MTATVSISVWSSDTFTVTCCPYDLSPHAYAGMHVYIHIYIYIFLFFRRQGFRMITFDRLAGPFQNFGRSRVMVKGRNVSFSDRARPLGGGVGRPKHPNPPPLPPFQNPRNIFEEKNFS